MDRRRIQDWTGWTAIAVVAGIGLIVAVIVIALFWPEWFAASGLKGKDRAEELGRVRTALLALLAGGIAVVGAWISHRSTVIAQGTLQVQRQGQVTDRFSRAVNQLGSDQDAIR